jgi:hypothetical protein
MNRKIAATVIDTPGNVRSDKRPKKDWIPVAIESGEARIKELIYQMGELQTVVVDLKLQNDINLD